MDKWVEQYLKSDKTSKDFRLAIRMMLESLNEMTLQQAMNKLKISLCEIAYINNCEAIKEVDLLHNEVDYGYQLGIGAEIKTEGKLKESLGRLLIFLKRKMANLESQFLSERDRAEDLRESIGKLMKGEAEIVICSVCKGSGITLNDDNIDEPLACWNCNGDKKVIQEITK